jgi:PAS domain S-box-containing protein
LEQARKEMKEQYDQIEHAKLRHEKTLEGTLDAVVTINSSGIVQFFNKAAEDLWGIPKNEVLGKSVRRLLPSKYKFVNDREIEDFLSINLNNWLNSRTEVSMENSMGEEVNILVTIAEAKVGSEVTYTAFIQNVSIELF